MDKPLEERELNDPLDEECAQSIVARTLARRGTVLESTEGQDHSRDAGILERKTRAGTRYTQSQRGDREGISEVEYCQTRLERIALVGLRTIQSEEEVDISLRELVALAETAGSQALDAVTQKRVKPDPAIYLGSGKAKELADIVRSAEVDIVIVDEELIPSQRRGPENVTDAKVVDQIASILDIFAQHAKSRESKAQVELVQLGYLLPRLRGWGESMLRQAGGRVVTDADIGPGGPGKTKTELDHHCIRTCMAKLREEIHKVEPARRTQRLSRCRGAVPSVAILGYTNAGKSALLNQLADAGVFVEDALFATLDPTVRRTETVDRRTYTLTDTVGLIHSLSTQLAEALRSILEEVGEADLLVHVVDVAHPDLVGQMEAVRLVLADIEGASSIPEIIVLNKVNLASPEHLVLIRTYFPEATIVSVNTGLGIDVLHHRIEEAPPRPSPLIDCVIPYSRGDLVHMIHEEGEVEREEYVSEGTRVITRVNERLGAHIREAGIILIGVGEDSSAGAGSFEQTLPIGTGSLEGTMSDKREGFEGTVPKRMESPKGSLDD